MPETMNAIIWNGKPFFEGLSYGAFEKPVPQGDWVLVYNKACGICGSDIHILTGEHNARFKRKENLPAILGHETCGVVAACDPSCGFKPGDRVAVEAIHTCVDFGGSCPRCEALETNHCKEGMTHVGLPYTRMLPGGYGEFSLVHKNHVHLLKDNVSFDEAALLDILVVNVHAMNIGNPQPGMRCAVLGCGVVGLNLVQLLKMHGAEQITAICKYPFQAELAMELGATDTILYDSDTVVQEALSRTGGEGFHQVYECVGGNSNALDEAIHICTNKGTVVMLGLFKGYHSVDLNSLMRREINILPANSYTYFNGESEFKASLRLLEEKKIDVAKLVSHRFAPEDYEAAIRCTMDKKTTHAVKVLFVRE